MIFTIILIFVTGLCIGSFLNVVILRALSCESIVYPASKCPQCQTPLRPWHNIPVVSYLVLRGQCAFCAAKISPQYPVIELITGALFVIALFRYGLSVQTVLAWIVLSLFVVIAVTDIRERVVFTQHTYILAGLGLINALFASLASGNFAPLVSSLLGAVVGILIMEAVARLGYLLAGARAFGEGDTYIAAALGAIFGWKELLVVLAVSLAVQLVFTLPVFARKLLAEKDYKTLGMSAAFFVYAAAMYIVQDALSAGAYALASLILAGLGIYLCRLVLSGLKENTAKLTYLPFGPAMVIAGALVLLL